MHVLSGPTCNDICQNSNEVHLFCSALPVQQAPVDVCTSNRPQVTAGFVKTVANRSKKNKEKVNENTNLFTHIILTFRGIVWK